MHVCTYRYTLTNTQAHTQLLQGSSNAATTTAIGSSSTLRRACACLFLYEGNNGHLACVCVCVCVCVWCLEVMVVVVMEGSAGKEEKKGKKYLWEREGDNKEATACFN